MRFRSSLISKLKYLGVSGPLLSWLQSYLSGRNQRVVLEGSHSEWKHLTAGVPQGSVLGPLLFLVYINDVTDNVHSEAFLYADDTMMPEIIDSPVESAAKMNSDLVSIVNWASKWMVTMNASNLTL